MPRFNPPTIRRAFSFGLKLGGLIWGGFTLGLISISTVDPYLALAWFFGQTVGLGIGAVAIHIVSTASSLRRPVLVAFVWILIMIVATVLLQSLGIVPTLRIS